MREYILEVVADEDVEALIGAGSVWSVQLRWIRCPDHEETASYSIHLNNETNSASGTIRGCCEKFARYLLACCRCNRYGGPQPDWYEGKKIALVQKGSPGEDGLIEFRFTDTRVLRPLKRALGETWDEVVEPRMCDIHRRRIGGYDYKKIFTAATKDEPDWGSVRACCEHFAIDCLVVMVKAVQKDLDDSVFNSDILE